MLVGQYARNIERPPFYTLNPNRIQSSDYSYQIGNPYLRPTYINRFSVTLVYNYRYTVTVGGNLHHDLIREFCKQDVANPDVSYITYENHDRENHWFVAVSLPYQPFTWCNLTGNFIGVRQDIRMTELSSFSSHYLGFANAIATFTLPAGFTVEARYSGTSRLYSGNSEVAPRHTVGVMARKKLLNDKLLLAVSVDNIFNQANEYASTLDVYRTSSRYENGFTGRVFKVALTWNFNSGKKVKIGLIGKYVELHDAYKSIVEAFIHAGAVNDCKVNIEWIHSEELNEENVQTKLKDLHGILVAPGFGHRGIAGKLVAIEYARTHNIPFFGICLGMQMAVIEFARNVLKMEGADSTEMAAKTQYPVIDLMESQQGITEKGGTMRLGAYTCELKEGSKAFEAYGVKEIRERHRHRYEFNSKYLNEFETAGMITTGRNPETGLTEIVEIPSHKWFVGVQFHPEYKSTVTKPHPLFVAFIKACLS